MILGTVENPDELLLEGMSSALANLGRNDEAKVSLARALEAKPDLSIEFLENNLPTKHTGGLEPYLNGLRLSGLS